MLELTLKWPNVSHTVQAVSQKLHRLWRRLAIPLAVAAVGPMAFVAFMAGPIARALDRGRPTIVGAALVGAVVVVAADLIGGHVIPDVHLPAGVVTGVTGAPVLLWLMTRGRTEGTL